MKLVSILCRACGESMKSTRIKREQKMKLVSILCRACGESMKSTCSRLEDWSFGRLGKLPKISKRPND